jgi:preprotein translocase subunit SecA
MTGTAETEAAEFHDIYKLDVNVIPTNRPVRRADANDRIYKTRREKYNAVINEIREHHLNQQPVLVGTVSVEASELLSRMLKREKIPHNVLNAKYHMQEAEIVARAGQAGTVTISTNMAGRGTDIKLGPGVTERGGLYVLGTERHEARRIDRQLRGRCARQGDPGASRFYVSFEDDLMRNFGAADRMTRIMERFGLEEGQELEHPWLNKSVETAQKRVEQRNYLARKRTLDFDDVMNNQREVVYTYRNETIDSEEPRVLIYEVIDEAVPAKVKEYLGDAPNEETNYSGLLHWVNTTFPLGLTKEKAQFETRSVDENAQFLIEKIKKAYEAKSSHEEASAVKSLERYIILNAIDRLWQEHLYAMDALREGVYLRGYAQKDPLIEYKTEAYDMFVELMANIKNEVLHNLFRSTSNLQAFENFLASLPQFLQREQNPPGTDVPTTRARQPRPIGENGDGEVALDLPVRRNLPKVGRNEPCPCGSGKKYKNCCGRTA